MSAPTCPRNIGAPSVKRARRAPARFPQSAEAAQAAQSADFDAETIVDVAAVVPHGEVEPAARGAARWVDLVETGMLVVNPHGRAIVVDCAVGPAWVTQENDGNDTVLAPEESWTSQPDGKVVLQPLDGACRVRVRFAS